MKSKEELNQLKTEYESFSKKISELSVGEIKEVVGGSVMPDLAGIFAGKDECKYRAKPDKYTSCPLSLEYVKVVAPYLGCGNCPINPYTNEK